jgi:hypothetical protein
MLAIYFGATKNCTEHKSGHVNGMSHVIMPFCLFYYVATLYQSADGRFRITLKALSIIRNKKCHSKEILFTMILWLKSMEYRKPCDERMALIF